MKELQGDLRLRPCLPLGHQAGDVALWGAVQAGCVCSRGCYCSGVRFCSETHVQCACSAHPDGSQSGDIFGKPDQDRSGRADVSGSGPTPLPVLQGLLCMIAANDARADSKTMPRVLPSESPGHQVCRIYCPAQFLWAAYTLLL